MKSKFTIFLMTFCMVLALSQTKTYAATTYYMSQFAYCVIYKTTSLPYYYIGVATISPWSITGSSSTASIATSYNNGAFHTIQAISADGYSVSNYFMTFQQALNWYTSQSNPRFYITGNKTGATEIYTVKGSSVMSGNFDGTYFPTYQDYLDELKSKWYEVMWDTLSDYFTNPVPFGWFKNLIDRIFGNSNNGGTIAENVNITAPTLAPTPTPIPYSTVVIPKTDIITGDTVYETNYYYINPSGTPIVTSSPPTNEPSSGGGGGGSTEYVPIGGDPFSIPAVNWLTSATIGDTNYDGIDSINEGMGSIDSIGSEYTDGMNAVQESTGTLPTSWLLLVGIAAAIPLLAGIVSRFLGG